MHSETVQLAAYPLFFLSGGCICYLLFRANPNLSRGVGSVPGVFLAMMTGSLIATALFDLVIFAFASFQFSRLHFVGPLAYADFLQRPSAVMLNLPFVIVGLWFGVRWFSSHRSKSALP
jgi:hypothetical protein